MIRNLLATTAIATLVATGAAMAQTTTPAPTAPAAPAAPAAPEVKQADGYLASNIIGETVYNGSGDDAENIGDVSDIVLAEDGSVEAIVIGVGGFLGIGEKKVALSYDLVEWTEMDGEEYIVIETTREALEAQEEFDAAAFEPQPADVEVGNTEPATAEDLAAAPVEGEGEADGEAAPSGDMAAAPADDAADPAATEEETAEAPADDAAATEEETAEAPADEQASTDETQTAAIDPSTLNEVTVGDIAAEDFIGTTVYGANDETIGEIGDVILSEDGQVEAVIVDVGGFLGMGEKPVAVGMDKLQFLSDEDGNMYLYTQFTKEQLEAQAAYDESTFAESRDEQLLMSE